jgi:hypothetical protein
VDTSVGAAGAMEDNIALVEIAKRVLNSALNGRPRSLPLPPHVVRAVVGERELEGWH